MAKVSLTPMFIKDTIGILRERGLRGLLFGTRATVSDEDAACILAAKDVAGLHDQGARSGQLQRVDVVHKGIGTVSLIPHGEKSALVFSDDTAITNGPDLWIYLSQSDNPKHSLGKYIDLGLAKGNKGAQVYYIDKPIDELREYKTAIVHCKQFDVLFSYAHLT